MSTSKHVLFNATLRFRFYVTRWSRSESIRIAMGIGRTWNMVSEAKALVTDAGKNLKSEKGVKQWLKSNRDKVIDVDNIDEEEWRELGDSGMSSSSCFGFILVAWSERIGHAT